MPCRPARFQLVGHSFGAGLISFALAGLPDAQPSPVASVTLLQGAFSHFAFAKPLPFDASRSGALAGILSRIDGPLVVCFSMHDGAVGTFYPLASVAARDDSAAANRALFRWGGMGANGAQVKAVVRAIGGAGPGTSYPFVPPRIAQHRRSRSGEARPSTHGSAQRHRPPRADAGRPRGERNPRNQPNSARRFVQTSARLRSRGWQHAPGHQANPISGTANSGSAVPGPIHHCIPPDRSAE